MATGLRAVGMCGIALALASAAAETPAQVIPPSKGTTLAGTEIKLPDALEGKTGILVLGFSKASQTQVAAWGKRLAADYRSSSSVVYYEIPMLAGAPRLLRGMILHQMGASVPESQRSHFLPLTEDEAAWRTLARYKKAEDAYILLIDGKGNVGWQTEGDASDEVYAALKQRLETLRSHPASPSGE